MYSRHDTASVKKQNNLYVYVAPSAADKKGAAVTHPLDPRTPKKVSVTMRTRATSVMVCHNCIIRSAAAPLGSVGNEKCSTPLYSTRDSLRHHWKDSHKTRPAFLRGKRSSGSHSPCVCREITSRREKRPGGYTAKPLSSCPQCRTPGRGRRAPSFGPEGAQETICHGENP